MSCRHWLFKIKEIFCAGEAHPKTLDIVRDCESRTYRVWCDHEGDWRGHLPNCVDLTVEQLREFGEAAIKIADEHTAWPEDQP